MVLLVVLLRNAGQHFVRIEEKGAERAEKESFGECLVAPGSVAPFADHPGRALRYTWF